MTKKTKFEREFYKSDITGTPKDQLRASLIMTKWMDKKSRLAYMMKMLTEDDHKTRFFSLGFGAALKEFGEPGDLFDATLISSVEFSDYLIDLKDLEDRGLEGLPQNVLGYLTEKHESREWDADRCNNYLHGFLFKLFITEKEKSKGSVDNFLESL